MDTHGRRILLPNAYLLILVLFSAAVNSLKECNCIVTKYSSSEAKFYDIRIRLDNENKCSPKAFPTVVFIKHALLSIEE